MRNCLTYLSLELSFYIWQFDILVTRNCHLTYGSFTYLSQETVILHMRSFTYLSQETVILHMRSFTYLSQEIVILHMWLYMLVTGLWHTSYEKVRGQPHWGTLQLCHAYTSINHVITRNTNTNHMQRLAHIQYPDHYICGRVWREVEEAVGVGGGGGGGWGGEVFKALYDGSLSFLHVL